MILQDKWDYVSRNRKNGCKLTRTVDFQPLPYIFWKHLDENDGEGNGNPLQCSCLENPVDRGAWWAAIYGVAQSQTRLKWLSMHACIGEGNGNPIQNSCLENPRDSRAWWAAVYRVTHSRTRLKRLSSSNRWEWANCSVTDRQLCVDTLRPSAFQEIQQGLGKAWVITVPDPVASSIYPSVFQFSSVAQSCRTLCNPMDCSTPGLPVLYYLPKFAQTHVHWVSDAIQPSHPLSSPSPPAFSLSQHQGLFQWVSSSHQVAKVLEFQLQHLSFQWIFRTDFL